MFICQACSGSTNFASYSPQFNKWLSPKTAIFVDIVFVNFHLGDLRVGYLVQSMLFETTSWQRGLFSISWTMHLLVFKFDCAGFDKLEPLGHNLENRTPRAIFEIVHNDSEHSGSPAKWIIHPTIGNLCSDGVIFFPDCKFEQIDCQQANCHETLLVGFSTFSMKLKQSQWQRLCQFNIIFFRSYEHLIFGQRVSGLWFFMLLGTRNGLVWVLISDGVCVWYDDDFCIYEALYEWLMSLNAWNCCWCVCLRVNTACSVIFVCGA